MKKTSTILLAFALGTSGAVIANTTAVPDDANKNAHDNTPSVGQQQIKWLGVSLVPLSPAMKNQLGNVIGADEGVMIREVQQNSPAAASGLQTYDILLAFDGNKVGSAKQVYDLVQQSKQEQQVKLDIIRQGDKKSIDVKIGLRQMANYGRSPFPGFQAPSSDFWNAPFPQFGQQPRWNPPFMQPNWPGFFDNNNFPTLPQLDPKNMRGNVQRWSHAESMNVKTLPDGKIHAELKTKDTNGNEKKFMFEGDKNSVIKQIEQQQDLPEAQKARLLGAINGTSVNFSSRDFPFDNNFMQGFPQTPFYGQPRGNAPQNRPQSQPQWRGQTY